MNRRSGALFAAFAIVLGLTAVPAARAQTVKLRLAHELPITHYGHVYIDRAKLVKEQSKGEIEVNVFPAGQLYKDADAVQALATGGLDMQLAVASYLSVVIPQARIIDLPYLADLRPQAGLQRPARAPDPNDRDDRARDAWPARAARQSDPDGIAAGSLGAARAACARRRLDAGAGRLRHRPRARRSAGRGCRRAMSNEGELT